MRHIDPFALEMLVTVADLAASPQPQTSWAARSRRFQPASLIWRRISASACWSAAPAGSRSPPPRESVTGRPRPALACIRSGLMLDDMRGKRATGRVRLGMPDDYVDVFLRPIVARFAREYPEVEIEVRCDLSQQVEADFAAGGSIWPSSPAITSSHPANCSGRADGLGGPPAATGPGGRKPAAAGALFRDLPHATAHSGRSRRGEPASPHRLCLLAYAGVVSAVESGFCLTALVDSTVPEGLRRIGSESGLPDLPPAEIAMLTPPRQEAAAARLSEAFRDAFSLR